MKLESIELFHIKIPLKEPFVTSFGRTFDRHLVILKGISDDGKIVYGEAPSLEGPFYSYETTKTTIHILKDFIVKKIIDHDFKDIEEVHKAMNFVKGHNIAKSGIDNLFYNLIALEQNKSLSELIEGNMDYIESGISIGIQDSIENLLKIIRESKDNGYKRIKIKIKKGKDIEVVKKVREVFPDIPLMVDANSDYTIDDIQLLKELDNYNLMMIEQPFAENNILDHSKLQELMNTPICLDESISSIEDAKLAIEIKACRIINIKLARVGGLLPAIRIHDYCKKNNIPVWCGGMLESGIGQAFAIALASLPNFVLPGDVAPSSRYFVDDIISPLIVLDEGKIRVPKKPGLGFIVDEDKIKKYLIESVKI